MTLYLEVYISLHSEEQELVEATIKETFNRLAIPFDSSFQVEEYIKGLITNLSLASRQSSEDDEGTVHKKINMENLSIEDSSNSKVVQTIYHLNHRPIILDPDNQALNWLRRQTST